MPRHDDNDFTTLFIHQTTRSADATPLPPHERAMPRRVLIRYVMRAIEYEDASI